MTSFRWSDIPKPARQRAAKLRANVSDRIPPSACAEPDPAAEWLAARGGYTEADYNAVNYFGSPRRFVACVAENYDANIAIARPSAPAA